jgi:hypothetical protein
MAVIIDLFTNEPEIAFIVGFAALFVVSFVWLGLLADRRM